MITALLIAGVLLGAAQSPSIEFLDCHEPGSCQAVEHTRVRLGRQHRALFVEGVTSYIDADLKLPQDARRLPNSPNPDDPIFVVTNPHVTLSQGPRLATVPSVAAAEALARKKGRRVAVAEFKLTGASSGPDRGPAIDIIVSAGTVVPQPRARSSGPQWKYVSQGFDAYHVYRRSDGRIVFRLQARAAD